MTASRVGILGGTFDPIHVGHLEAAGAARKALHLDRVLLLPSRTPPHKNTEPRASVFHRFAMTALAANSMDGLLASDLELQREGPSYTAPTLEALHREGFVAPQLFFILGADAYAEISTWYDYPRFFELANFVVISRPGSPLPKSDRIPTPQSSPLRSTASAPKPSAKAGLIPSAPTSVFVVEANTPAVSSTEVRRRVGSGELIDSLVPAAVAEHIRRHRLYIPAPVAAIL